MKLIVITETSRLEIEAGVTSKKTYLCIVKKKSYQISNVLSIMILVGILNRSPLDKNTVVNESVGNRQS